MELQRERIAAAIARAATRPVTLLVAPAGSGKSTALRHFVGTLDGQTLWFDVRALHTSLTRFVRGFAATLEPLLPKVAQSLAIAHERAMQSARPADVLAAWLAEHLRDVRRTIVIDNYHHCEFDPTIASFLAGVVGHTRSNVRWLIATRSAAELPLATWLACSDAHVPIDEKTLKLAAAEARALTANIAPDLDPVLAEHLLDITRGSIGQVVFALQTAAGNAGIAKRIIDAGGCAYENSVDEALAALAPADRSFIQESVGLPDLEPGLLAAAGFADASTRLAALETKLPHVFERRGGTLVYKTLFADLLYARRAARGVDAVHKAYAQAGAALAGCGRFVEALAYYVHAREFGAIAQLIEARGMAFVEAGYGDAIVEAIDALDPIARAASPVVLAIKATFESRLGRFDTAESWFELALERTADAGVRGQIMYQYSTHLLRFQRPEAVASLEALAADMAANPDLHCYAQSALGPAYVFECRYEDASAAADAALALASASESQHLRARVLHQAAYVALYRNDGASAKALATQSLCIAQEHGYFDIAAGALSVLYNVAADIEDDPAESLRLLDAVAECAAKSGSLTSHILALAAKLEIEVERGDEDAIEELDAKLQTVDARFCGRAIYEALLPCQALRAAWAGDYAGAYHMLAASAEAQWSADRKALRWAEIAVFAAAAAMRVEATMAVRSALELLEPLEPGLRVTRARLLVALAMVLLGRSEAALELFEHFEAEPQMFSPRLSALRQTIVALCDRYRGVRNHRLLLGLLRALGEQHFGGLGRLIVTCPLAENATLRLGRLSRSERRILTEVGAGDSLVTSSRVDAIVAKLGCVDRHAVASALPRLPLNLERTSMAPMLLEA